MNITNEEVQEINRAVALAMGWRWQEGEPTDDGGGGWIDPMWRDRDDEPTYSSGLFCTDPAAADIVRIEIERRGWDLQIRISCTPLGTQYVVGIDAEGEHYSAADIKSLTNQQWQNGLGRSLCAAFLAAHEATDTDRAGDGPERGL